MRHLSIARLALVGAILAAAVVPSTAAAADSSVAGAAAAGRMTVKVDIARFKATKSGPVAIGTATATLRGLGGFPQTVTQRVRLAATNSGRCRILTLVLNQLDLTLLGLVIDLNRVHLTITAIRGGGILGDLFCGLADTTVPTTP